MWKRVFGTGVRVGLALSVSSLGMLHCGGSDDGSEFENGSGAKSGNGGGSGGGIDLDGAAASSGTGSGGTINPDAACAVEKDDATLVPVNMLIMFDRSGSMNDNNK